MISALALCLTLFIVGCQVQTKSVKASANEAGSSFKGRDVYEQLEGGFWGIITDNGIKLDGPISENFQHSNLRIRGIYKALKDTAWFLMWGNLVSFWAYKKART